MLLIYSLDLIDKGRGEFNELYRMLICKSNTDEDKDNELLLEDG